MEFNFRIVKDEQGNIFSGYLKRYPGFFGCIKEEEFMSSWKHKEAYRMCFVQDLDGYVYSCFPEEYSHQHGCFVYPVLKQVRNIDSNCQTYKDFMKTTSYMREKRD